MKGSVFIIGGGGQDGTLLRNAYAKMNMPVYFTTRRNCTPKFPNEKQISLGIGNNALVDALLEIKPKVIFYCAAAHTSSEGEVNQIESMDINYIIPKQLCERLSQLDSHFIYFNSIKSLKIQKNIIRAENEYNMDSAYARSKALFSKWFSSRDTTELAISNIYYSNHESSLRGEQFFSMKVCRHIADRLRGSRNKNKIALHTPYFWCDWGSAVEYMQIVSDLDFLNKAKNKSFTFATGTTHYGINFLEELYGEYGFVLQDNVEFLTRQKLPKYSVCTAQIEHLGFKPKKQALATFKHVISEI